MDVRLLENFVVEGISMCNLRSGQRSCEPLALQQDGRAQSRPESDFPSHRPLLETLKYAQFGRALDFWLSPAFIHAGQHRVAPPQGALVPPALTATTFAAVSSPLNRPNI